MLTHTVLRASNRLLVRVVMWVAILAALVCLIFGCWVIDDTFDTAYTFTAWVSTPLDLRPIAQGTIGESEVQYHEVIVYSFEPLLIPRLFLAVSHALNFSLGLFASIVVALLCRRLLAQRRFTRTARWSTVTIGALAAATSFASPLLHSLSGQFAARALGLPTSSDAYENSTVPPEEQEWIVPQDFSYMNVNWALLVLGVMLILTAATFLRGERLQNDMEGLV